MPFELHTVLFFSQGVWLLEKPYPSVGATVTRFFV